MIDTPGTFRNYIHVQYPPNNTKLFEEWFFENYKEEDNVSDYVYLPIFWTSYHVNNNYGNNAGKRKELQNYIDSLDRNKKYFTVLQYDDGCLTDFKDLDIKIFGASGKDATNHIPLLCMPQPFNYPNPATKRFACFMGSDTHIIRTEMLSVLSDNPDYYINTGRLNINEYCSILKESIFSLCPRGYGINSFRIAESVQYGAIPVYISDEFSLPGWLDFKKFGVLIDSKDCQSIDSILKKITPDEVKRKQEILSRVYQDYYTYESNYKLILSSLHEK